MWPVCYLHESIALPATISEYHRAPIDPFYHELFIAMNQKYPCLSQDEQKVYDSRHLLVIQPCLIDPFFLIDI